MDEEFVIDNDEKAEWALRKIREATEERDRLLSLAQLERLRIDKEEEGIRSRFESDTGFLKVLLQNYFDTVQHKETKTQEKYQLLSGALVKKKGGVKYTRDDAAIIKWIQDNQRNEFLKVKLSPDWENLKKQTTVHDGVVIFSETGEVVEGVTVEQEPDEFVVKL